MESTKVHSPTSVDPSIRIHINPGIYALNTIKKGGYGTSRAGSLEKKKKKKKKKAFVWSILRAQVQSRLVGFW
jgi:hypothetical protein